MAFMLEIAVLGRRWQQSLLALAPWLLIATGPMIVTKVLQPDELLASVPAAWQRPLVAADAIGFYFIKLLWPLHLGPDYGHSPRVALANGLPYIALAMFIALLLALLAARAWHSLVVLLLFVVGLLPVLGLVPFAYQRFSTVADRYAYLAMIAPSLAMAWILARFGRPASWFVATLLLAGLAVLSHVQATRWQNNESLYLHAIQVNQRSLLAPTASVTC